MHNKKLISFLEKLIKNGFEISNYDKSSEFYNTNNIRSIIDSELPIAISFMDESILVIILKFNKNIPVFNKFTKIIIKHRNKPKKVCYFIKCNNKEFLERLYGFQNVKMDKYTIGLTDNYDYEINDISLDKTAEINENDLRILEQLDNKLKQLNESSYFITKSRLEERKDYNISFYILNNLIKLHNIDDKTMQLFDDTTKSIVETEKIHQIGIKVNKYERKLLHALLLMLSTTNYYYTYSSKEPIIEFKKSDLYYACGCKRIKNKSGKLEYPRNQRRDIDEALRNLDKKHFLLRYKQKGLDITYIHDYLFEILEKKTSLLTVKLSENFTRHIKTENYNVDNSPYFMRLDKNYSNILEGSKSSSYFIFLDYLTLIMEQNQQKKVLKGHEIKSKNLVNKINLSYLLENGELAELSSRLLKLFEDFKQIGIINYTYNSVSELRNLIKNNSIIIFDIYNPKKI